MKPVQGDDMDVSKTNRLHERCQPPAEECSLIGRVAHSGFDPGNVLLNHDLGVEHVRLGEAYHPARLEQALDVAQRRHDIQVVQHR